MDRKSATKKSKHAREICGKWFPTSKAIRQRCRDILDEYAQTHANREIILSRCHTEFFVSLIKPVGQVRRAFRSTSEGQIGRHLRFEYEDGSSELASWNDACGSPPKYKKEASDAMRFESDKSSRDLVATFFSCPPPWKCQKSGQFVSRRGGFEGDLAHVHHDGIEWAAIRDAWLQSESITLNDVPIEKHFDGRGYQMIKGSLTDSWRHFHDSVANLVVVSQRWHIEHHAQERATKKRNAG